MINFRAIFLVIGSLLCVLSIAMLVPALADYYNGSKNYRSFETAAFITLFFGGSFIFATRRGKKEKSFSFNTKSAFLLTTLSWLSLALFSSIPFMLGRNGVPFIDALFEAMSGITTTGASIYPSVKDLDKGILLWRAILQFLGGIGIIVMAMSVLPLLKIGGMQLFRTESSDNAEKIFPKTTQIASSITWVYLGLNAACILLLVNVGGLSFFDAICHSFSAVASGGFSYHDGSIAYFDSVSVEVIIMFFMIAGNLPFVFYVQAYRGNTKPFVNDKQVRFFLVNLFFFVMIMTAWLRFNIPGITFEEALRKAAFNMTSLLTATGYAIDDYTNWGVFAAVVAYVAVNIGGCTGSSTGGIKIFRFMVLFEYVKVQIYKLLHPHGVIKPKFNNKPIPEEAFFSVLGFIVMYATVFVVSASLLSATNLDFMSSLSAAGGMITNFGPGLGDVIGPSGNYSSLTDFGKWVCMITMLIGRLELFTLLIILTPMFWRR